MIIVLNRIQKTIYIFLLNVLFLFGCSAPFPKLSSSVLLLGLLNPNGILISTDPNLALKYIFITTGTFSGQLGAGTVGGGDTICANEKNANFSALPGAGTDYKALIASQVVPIRRACNATANCTNRAENSDWVLLPNQDYYLGTVASPIKTFTTNSAGIVVFPAPGLIVPMDPAAGTIWWTGLESGWLSSADHCTNWTDGTAGAGFNNGQNGVGNTLSETAIAATFSDACDQPKHLVCVRQ
ncbi:DUF1554 domain-containing protein [Leptospira sp. WS92.C1]